MNTLQQSQRRDSQVAENAEQSPLAEASLGQPVAKIEPQINTEKSDLKSQSATAALPNQSLNNQIEVLSASASSNPLEGPALPRTAASAELRESIAAQPDQAFGAALNNVLDLSTVDLKTARPALAQQNYVQYYAIRGTVFDRLISLMANTLKWLESLVVATLSKRPRLVKLVKIKVEDLEADQAKPAAEGDIAYNRSLSDDGSSNRKPKLR